MKYGFTAPNKTRPDNVYTEHAQRRLSSISDFPTKCEHCNQTSKLDHGAIPLSNSFFPRSIIIKLGLLGKRTGTQATDFLKPIASRVDSSCYVSQRRRKIPLNTSCIFFFYTRFVCLLDVRQNVKDRSDFRFVFMSSFYLLLLFARVDRSSARTEPGRQLNGNAG